MRLKIGDEVRFERFDCQLTGHVVKILEKSIVVKLTEDSHRLVKKHLPNEMTVVNHRSYQRAE